MTAWIMSRGMPVIPVPAAWAYVVLAARGIVVAAGGLIEQAERWLDKYRPVWR